MGYSRKKKSEIVYSPFPHFTGKGFNFETPTLRGLNLVVRLNEKQILIENFFLHNEPNKSTEYLNFFLGRYYYRDINLYFVYDKQYKQWFTSGPEFYNGAISEKVNNRNFNLKQFAKNFYYIDKKGSDYATGHVDQRWDLGNRSYFMPIVWDKYDIWIAKNEIFYTTANASQWTRSRTFLKNHRVVVGDIKTEGWRSHTSSYVIRRQRSCEWSSNFVRTIGSFVLFTDRQLAIAPIAVSFFLVVVEQ